MLFVSPCPRQLHLKFLAGETKENVFHVRADVSGVCHVFASSLLVILVHLLESIGCIVGRTVRTGRFAKCFADLFIENGTRVHGHIRRGSQTGEGKQQNTDERFHNDSSAGLK